MHTSILKAVLGPVALAVVLMACASPAPQTGPTATPAAEAPTVAPTAAPEPTGVVAPAATTPPTAAPTGAATVPPATVQPTAAPTAQPSAPTQQPQPTQSAPVAAFGSEVLFLRNGALIAFDLDSKQQRQIADGVRDFAATPDGGTLALVRGTGRNTEIWTVRRDGSALTQLTHNDRAEATPSWAPDGLALVFASAATDEPYVREWPGWSRWCAASEVHLLNLSDGAEQSFGAGCDPAFSPDGLRIAYAAPPRTPEAGFPDKPPLVTNSIRLINRMGQNGWDFARASGVDAPAPNNGRLVYAPAWSPDSKQLVYHRFLGYQALVDINLSEIGGSLEGKGRLLAQGAGWLLPARFAPDGRMLAISENNYSDARGFGGYDNWSVELIRLEGTRAIALPSGSVQAIGQQVELLPRGQAVAWSPDGGALVVELPPGWRSDLPADEPVGADERPGEIWRWQPGKGPGERLLEGVDFASPLAWLLPTPQVAIGAGGYQLVYPAGWRIAEPTEFEERTAIAPDGLRLMSAAPSQVSDPASATAEELFGFLVAEGGTYDRPIAWPDGSVYRAFTATDRQGRPIAGATRVVRAADGRTVVVLYVTTPERWPLERALAQALLARSGPAS